MHSGWAIKREKTVTNVANREIADIVYVQKAVMTPTSDVNI